MGKMFLMAPLNNWEQGEASVTIKCDPEYTIELREQYESIYPGPYVSNKHWNALSLFKNELKPKLVFQLIDHSYEMVIKGMTKKMKEELSIPLITSNRINMPETAEKILLEGDADMISMARPFLADPEWVNKAEADKVDEINTCIGCIRRV